MLFFSLLSFFSIITMSPHCPSFLIFINKAGSTLCNIFSRIQLQLKPYDYITGFNNSELTNLFSHILHLVFWMRPKPSVCTCVATCHSLEFGNVKRKKNLKWGDARLRQRECSTKTNTFPWQPWPFWGETSTLRSLRFTKCFFCSCFVFKNILMHVKVRQMSEPSIKYAKTNAWGNNILFMCLFKTSEVYKLLYLHFCLSVCLFKWATLKYCFYISYCLSCLITAKPSLYFSKCAWKHAAPLSIYVRALQQASESGRNRAQYIF